MKNTLDHGSVCKLITSCYSAQKVCSRCTLSVCLSVCLFAFAISQAWFPFKHTQRKYRNARITRKGTFLRAAIRARNVRTIVHHRAETLRAEKVSALSDTNRFNHRDMSLKVHVYVSRNVSSCCVALPQIHAVPTTANLLSFREGTV